MYEFRKTLLLSNIFDLIYVPLTHGQRKGLLGLDQLLLGQFHRTLLLSNVVDSTHFVPRTYIQTNVPGLGKLSSKHFHRTLMSDLFDPCCIAHIHAELKVFLGLNQELLSPFHRTLRLSNVFDTGLCFP